MTDIDGRKEPMNILAVDLSTGDSVWNTLDRETQASFLGGRGLGAHYLFKHLPPGLDPLSPENILTIWTSPIMGTGSLSMVKTCGVTKSPATGTILMSLMGGYFGPEMRYAGADGLIFRGAAEKPVVLLIQEGEAELIPAGHLWGKTTRETEHILEQELGLRKMQVASIGPAGENMVTFGCLMHGGDAMGRGGIGAVMGSKNLKAIVVSGRDRPDVHDPERFKEVIKRLAHTYRESTPLKLFGATGTTRHVDGLNARVIYPTRNFQSSRFESFQQINAESLYKGFVSKRVTCHTCTVRCRRESILEDGPYGEVQTEGPEYETLWGFGGNCGNHSLEAVIAANDLCLEYGLDTISTGMVISFAMECYEKGLITAEDTDGLALTFGNPDAMVAAIHKIGRREGIGELLAQGTRRAAEHIGQGAEEYAMQVKGLELAGYDPRGAKGMGLGYATSPRGACHERGYLLGEVVGGDPEVDRYGYEGKGALVKTTQDTVAVKDALGFCVLSSAGTSLGDLAEMFSTATGIELGQEELLRAGERICNLERLFNLREGFTREDDTLPKRLLEEAIEGTDGNPHTVDLDRMLDDYYAARGWDQEGVPLPETLARLGLDREI
jgi:aldehyde:ferredoxin oxidoreductase